MKVVDSDIRLDRNGRIEPTAEALAKVNRKYPDQPDHQKWRLAQAQTLIDAHKGKVQRDAERRV
jgi:hypothetical protein